METDHGGALLSPKKEKLSPKRARAAMPSEDAPHTKHQKMDEPGDASDSDVEEPVPKLVRRGNAQRRTTRVVIDSSDDE